jgi:hypothetical protein
MANIISRSIESNAFLKSMNVMKSGMPSTDSPHIIDLLYAAAASSKAGLVPPQ